eukprot:919297_1
MSRNRNDFLLQIFDILIMKAIWVSYKLKTTEPSNMQRYLGLLEATFESAPQIMLTMVFMLKSAETNTKISAVFILSTLFSLWSLSSRVISDDSIMFKEDWNGLNIACKHCPILNLKYIYRMIWRLLEITNRVCVWCLLWVGLSGIAISIIIAFELIYLLITCIMAKKPDALGMMMYLMTTAGDKSKMFGIFGVYRVISFYVYMIIISVRYKRVIHTDLGLFMLCYGWITGPLWMIIGWMVIYIASIGYVALGTPTRVLARLAKDGNFKDVIEIIIFGVKPLEDERDAVWIARYTLEKCDNIDYAIQIWDFVCAEYPDIWNKYNEVELTPLMLA